jgi:hypothetical protein
MTTSSANLGLTLYNNTTDQSGSFITWTRNMSGSSASNMTKIDAYAGGISASMTNLTSSISGSVTTINSTISSISGSITSILASIVTLNTRLQRIGEFSGAGQADFTGISGSFTHLLLIGTTAANLGNVPGTGSVSVDFNGDSTQSNYGDITWQKNTTVGVTTEYFTSYLYGAIMVATTIDYTAYPSYGIPFLALVPNFSASGGLYKNALGFSGGYYSGAKEIRLNGGFWRSTAAITRLRVFATYGSSLRRDFGVGTKITLYGLG